MKTSRYRLDRVQGRFAEALRERGQTYFEPMEDEADYILYGFMTHIVQLPRGVATRIWKELGHTYRGMPLGEYLKAVERLEFSEIASFRREGGSVRVFGRKPDATVIVAEDKDGKMRGGTVQTMCPVGLVKTVTWDGVEGLEMTMSAFSQRPSTALWWTHEDGVPLAPAPRLQIATFDEFQELQDLDDQGVGDAVTGFEKLMRSRIASLPEEWKLILDIDGLRSAGEASVGSAGA
jgi:hypothetical protein